MAATFGQLKTRLDLYVNRTDSDYASNRDLFILTGIRWIQDQLLADFGAETRWTNAIEITSGVTSVQTPIDWRPSSEVRLYRLDGQQREKIRRIPLEWFEHPFWDTEQGEEVDLSDPTVRGVPRYFALRGRTIEFRPAADGAYTFEMHGLGYLDDLDADGDTNALTIEAENLCLWAALRECWSFLEDAGRAKFWENRAREAAMAWASARVDAEATAHSLVMESPGS